VISDAELAQMRADAERIEALRQSATEGPWGFDSRGDWSISTKRDASGRAKVVVSGRGACEYGIEPVSSLANGDFIAATRTDPSAANVLRLLEEVERLRQVAKRNIPHPTYFPVAFNAEHFERIGEVMKHYDARRAIDACHIHGVPVPEHLRPYEKGGDA